uniref:aminomethyl-transferring glycine dehydrogenase n=1 Tax=Thaumasiovibrio occultus TaxID=1891184 RepID=UPI000B3518FC|nr:aminomethyl-transferring glycine dehydrogenase [Thaumasiovibrio occultus]
MTARSAAPTNNDFAKRHIGISAEKEALLLSSLNVVSLDQLVEQTVPAAIRLPTPLALPEPLTEPELLAQLKQIASNNKIYRSFIGQGYYNTFTPSVILRNVLENPGWYTAYTPYQPEISQGRLESLLNFQQMIMDMTATDVANASLLDEATAAAEAMTLCKRASKHKSQAFFVDQDIHPQTLAVLMTRAEFIGIELIVDVASQLTEHAVFGALLNYPGSSGNVQDLTPLIEQAHQNNALVVVATDLLALTILTPPGEMKADVAIGSAQRFGVPMGFGGPHAAFIATTDKLKRMLPGRIIGVSKDSHGNTALRMAMQTREQHIRREKATSNICTAQALLANIAAFYAVYHGYTGLLDIGRRVHFLTQVLASSLNQQGYPIANPHFFDTITVISEDNTEEIYARALAREINLRYYSNRLGISLDETSTIDDVIDLLNVFQQNTDATAPANALHLDHDEIRARIEQLTSTVRYQLPDRCQRKSTYLNHPVFHRYQSETQLMRYIKQLENKDFSLTHGMIPLGSCTMKLNAATEMLPISWPEFNQIHPFAPSEQTRGYQQLTTTLSEWLCEITGYDSISLQPNSGAQGEYAGLLAIQRYHQSRGDHHRTICLIPSSAHGTNPASAAMVSMQVVVVKCDDNGNVDLDDLQRLTAAHQQNLACIMITYPSTHGVFEENVTQICKYVHTAGGQVYLDGANMNAQVGLTSPGLIGADVSHLNLHKTFCIPHGGGGPGMGPIGVKAHLAPFLPGHPMQAKTQSAVAAAPFGSASILPISYAYIAMMGASGLTKATQIAIANANYVMERLAPYFPIAYRGSKGRVAHECIIDIRPIKKSTQISDEDIAKRLMDYGFHAPTMSFPVVGTLMIEPTESEDLNELDRFCDALIAIRKEIDKIECGEWPLDDNPLVNAPHTYVDLASAEWRHPYSRQEACFPMPNLFTNKYWPTVNRVDNVFGDRNLICSCPPLSDYE